MNEQIKKTVEMFPQTNIWVDSCAKADLEYAIGIGACGATTNPVIVGQVLKTEMPLWEDTIRTLFTQNAHATEDEVAWELIERMGKRGAEMLRPIYDASHGKRGRISMQTNIKNYRNAEAMTEQAIHFGTLFPNLNVKMPAGIDGLKAMEEATFAGISLNATVCFSVAQSIAVAEAIERGLARREAAGLSNDTMAPVCTIMLGRVDDWLKKQVSRDKLAVRPECLEWAGVAIFKRAYAIYKQRGYRTRLLTAAYRNVYHWSQLIGGPVSMTIPKKWLQVFNESGFEPENTLETPVDESILAELKTLKEFRRAYDEDGMRPEEFEHYGAFVTCLEGFFKGYEDLLATIRPYQFSEL